MSDLEIILQAAEIMANAPRETLEQFRAMLEIHLELNHVTSVGDDLACAWINIELDACE